MLVGLGLSLAACAEKVQLPSRYSEQLGGGHQRVEDHAVSKKKFLATLRQGEGANEVRLVSVFRREGQQLPQYRIFDVRAGSAYQLLGLEDGDIILAANDHIIYDPGGFRTFVIDYMKEQSSATLTVSRGGVASLYRYSFVE
jgi:type II secretory pathway component PulC